MVVEYPEPEPLHDPIRMMVWHGSHFSFSNLFIFPYTSLWCGMGVGVGSVISCM